MYEYVNGEKGNNIGFAKIASQNQRYKIKIHIKNFALNGRVLNVYGFVRGDGILYSSCLGSIKMINGIGEGIFVGNTGELWEKYRFLDMSGLILCGSSLSGTQEATDNIDEKAALLQQEKNRFCATQWKEGTIMLEQLDIFQGQEKPNVINAESESRIEHKLNAEVENKTAMETERERKTLQAAETYTQYQTGRHKTEVSQITEDSFNYEKQVVPDFGGEKAMEQRKDEYMSNDKKEDIYTLDYATTDNKKQKIQYAEQQIEEQNEQSLEAEQENSIQYPENNQEDIWDLFEQRRKQIQLQFEEIKHGTSTEMKEEVQDETEWKPGEDILEKFPEMCPFFDDSVSASVRIEPKDIGVLPMEHWYLANNSFLLHGYYCYRHLLFVKMEVEQEKVYAIAVPGNSNYREKFMANMFGFEQFKTVQKKENAGFGYWWKRIF